MAVPYYGDFPEDATVRIPFNTFSSDDPQASVTITNLADADLMVHKDGGTTQIATDGATISIDFDAITGNHYAVIDTSAHADYSTGSEYAIRMEGTTVDGGTINAWIGTWSIERSGGALALIKAGNLGSNVTQWNGTNVATPTTAGVPEIELARISGQTVTAAAAVTVHTDLGVNATAQAALEDQFDGTGITGESYPATQLQVNSLGSISGGFSSPIAGATITTGTQTLTYAATEEEDGVLHEIAPVGGDTDFYYELDVGQLSTIISVEWLGRINSNGDSVTVQYYDWVSASYKTVRILSGSNSSSLIPDTFVFPINATGTGANIGLGRLRFSSTTSTNIVTDRARVMFSERASGISNGSTVTLDSSAENKNFIGNNWTLVINSQNLNNMYAEGGSASGTGLVTSGRVHFNHFSIGTVTVGPAHFDTCGFSSTWTMGSAGDYEMINCHTETPASGNITIDGNSLGSATSLVIQAFKGSITFVNLTSFHTMTISGTELGNIVLGGADATIKIRGIYESLTNNLTGSPSVTVEAIKATDTGDILVDTQDIQSRLPAALVSGRIDSNIGSIDGNQPLATRLKEFVDANVLFSDTAQAGGASTITLAVGTSLVDDDLHDFAIYIDGGTGAGQFARINGVIAATQVATIVTPVDGWQTVPDNTSTYIILSAGSILHISEIHQAALTQISAEMDANSTQLAKLGTPAADISADIAAVKVDTETNLPALIDDLAVKKNTAFSNFEFLMVDATDFATPETGLTVTGQRSLDGAAFAAVSGAIAEVGSGIYQFDALAADTNGDVLTWKFSSAGAADRFVTIKTIS